MNAPLAHTGDILCSDAIDRKTIEKNTHNLFSIYYMEQKKDLFHRAHIMFGGFLPYVRVYNWVSAVVIFGRCIAKDGYDYKKGSLMEEVLGDGGRSDFRSRETSRTTIVSDNDIISIKKLKELEYYIDGKPSQV